MNRSVDKYFDNWHDPKWFNDPFVKEIVQTVDKTEIVGPYLAISPVFGAMPPTKISGGAKALILAYKTDNFIYGSAMGDNCANLLARIGKLKDVDIYFGHIMRFTTDLDAVCMDTGHAIKNYYDFVKEYAYCVDGIDFDEED